MTELLSNWGLTVPQQYTAVTPQEQVNVPKGIGILANPFTATTVADLADYEKALNFIRKYTTEPSPAPEAESVTDPLKNIDRSYNFTPEVTSSYYRPWEHTTGGTEVPLVTGNTVSEGLKRGNHTAYEEFDPVKLAQGIMQNRYGNGPDRIQRLTQIGYTPEQIGAAQKLVNQYMKHGTVPYALVKRSIAPTVADAIRYNRNDLTPKSVNTNTATNTNTNNVPAGYNPSGYVTGHEAKFNPVTGRLEFI